MTEDESALVEAIESAFADVRLGEGISLNMTEYYDSGGSMPEYEERAQGDEREDWRRIPDGTLEQFTVTFSFTDLEGFRFYIPAYMRWTVRNHRTSDSIIGDNTIYALTPHHFLFEKTSFRDWFTERQFAVILRFLEFAVENYNTLDARLAERYLRRFRSGRLGGSATE